MIAMIYQVNQLHHENLRSLIPILQAQPWQLSLRRLLTIYWHAAKAIWLMCVSFFLRAERDCILKKIFHAGLKDRNGVPWFFLSKILSGRFRNLKCRTDLH